jgi:hypothetical protein
MDRPANDWLTKRIADGEIAYDPRCGDEPIPTSPDRPSAKTENDPAERARKAQVERVKKERVEQDQPALDRAEWQLAQIQQIRGPALSEGIHLIQYCAPSLFLSGELAYCSS